MLQGKADKSGFNLGEHAPSMTKASQPKKVGSGKNRRPSSKGPKKGILHQGVKQSKPKAGGKKTDKPAKA